MREFVERDDAPVRLVLGTDAVHPAGSAAATQAAGRELAEV